MWLGALVQGGPAAVAAAVDASHAAKTRAVAVVSEVAAARQRLQAAAKSAKAENGDADEDEDEVRRCRLTLPDPRLSAWI
jgi:hypothetical protein